MTRLFCHSLLLLLLALGAAQAPPPTPEPATKHPPQPEPEPTPRSAAIILDGIKYTDLEKQGSLTRKTCRTLDIPTVPIAYHGGVDFNQDGTITPKDIERFQRWADLSIPRTSTSLAVLDYEQPWWDELTAREITLERLDQILGVYAQGLAIAKETRPGVRWGYWGLPTMRNVSAGWKEQDLSVTSLMLRQGAVFPGAYDCNPDKGPDEFKWYVQRVLESIQGQRPLWAFINTRYCGQGGDRSKFIPIDVVLANADAILQARWVDDEGVAHRAAGVVLWDTYGWSDEADWPELDRHNAKLFSQLHALAQHLQEDEVQSRPGPPSPPEP
ncbi:MAG: hypothetical protein P8K80_10755 [Phycisphaerales bacterium]|nr:hypothetical protein [Phycisphaerales bacterium]